MIPFSAWFLINFPDAGSNIFSKPKIFFKRENYFVVRFITHDSCVLPENNFTNVYSLLFSLQHKVHVTCT